MNYTGYKILTPNDDELSNFYSTNRLDSSIQMNENEYLVFTDEAGGVIDTYCYIGGKYKKVRPMSIVSPLLGEIKPRNLEQVLAFHMLKSQNARIKVLTGPYGSGKTMSMMAQAIDCLRKGEFQKIIYIRNNINVKDTMELGSLPGSYIDKLGPYLAVMGDHLGSQEALQDAIESGTIEPIHLGFLRGRDLRNSLIYCTEAQNLSVEHMKLLIGRVGEGSELWCDGDFNAQVDRATFERSNGLRTVIEKLAGNEYFGYVHLIKSERSKVAALASLLD